MEIQVRRHAGAVRKNSNGPKGPLAANHRQRVLLRSAVERQAKTIDAEGTEAATSRRLCSEGGIPERMIGLRLTGES